MATKDDIKKLWVDNFRDDSREWIDMYFERVFNPRHLMTIVDEAGMPISSLLLQRYDFGMGGPTVAMGYIAGASTRRNMRGRGYMSRLMVEALRASRERGDALCALIPAHDWLYFFYDRFGFSTAFFVDTQRFTALHSFSGPEHYHEVDNASADDVYETMSRLERLQGYGVLHSHDDFLNILADQAVDGVDNARFVAMASEKGEVCSLAWAVRRDDFVEVRQLLSVDDDAETAALRRLREYFPGLAFRVFAPARSGRRRLHPRAMGRIVNPTLMFEALALTHPDWHSMIRISDNLLEENTAVYRVAHGKVEVLPYEALPASKLDYDLKIETLAPLLFSDSSLADTLRIPCSRAHISLMLD